MTNFLMIIHLRLSCVVESHEPNTLQIIIQNRLESYVGRCKFSIKYWKSRDIWVLYNIIEVGFVHHQ